MTCEHSIRHLGNGFHGTLHPDVVKNDHVRRVAVPAWRKPRFSWKDEDISNIFVCQHIISYIYIYIYMFMRYILIWVYRRLYVILHVYIYIYTYPEIVFVCVLLYIICSRAFPSHHTLPPKDAALSLSLQSLGQNRCRARLREAAI